MKRKPNTTTLDPSLGPQLGQNHPIDPFSGWTKSISRHFEAMVEAIVRWHLRWGIESETVGFHGGAETRISLLHPEYCL